MRRTFTKIVLDIALLLGFHLDHMSFDERRQHLLLLHLLEMYGELHSCSCTTGVLMTLV
jgi:hypothetical protein